MVLNAVISVTFIFFRWQWAHSSGAFTLVDVWAGVSLLSCSRALTFSFRHFVDPRGPLAVPVPAAAGDREREEGAEVEDGGSPNKDQGVGDGR